MKFVAASLAAIVMASPAMAQDPAFDRAVAAVEERLQAIDTVPDVIPGRTLIMVKAGQAPVMNIKGSTRVEGGQPITEDTPMYIASMTKAFVGLMAARLDEMGVMPLDSTLGTYFPDMKVEGVDVGAITMRQLLSHQPGFEAPALNLRTAYTDTVPVGDYTAVVNAVGSATEPGFSYSNLGYLLYGAALERKTNKSWRAWIDDIVFDPLGMQHSSARTSDFTEVTHLHERFEDGWRTYAPKTDDIMHAAGGLVLSPADMARWLAANAGQEGGIPRSTFATAQTKQVDISQNQGPMKCSGYALGWRRCEVYGLTFLEHGGGYTGMRSEMIVLPEQGVGFAVMFNSDSMTGTLSGNLMLTFVSAYAGQTDGIVSADELKAKFVEDTTAYRTNRSERERKALADEKWGGWTWHPDAAALTEFGGRYASPGFGELVLAVEGDALVGTLNGKAVSFRPAVNDLFGAKLVTTGEMEPFAIQRDDAGMISAVDYGGVVFTRAR